MNYIRYFELAKRVAKKSNHPTYKLGCILFKKKKIVGLGFNQIKTHTKSPDQWKMLHAEVHSVLGADPADMHGASAFVYMENKNGKVGKAKPCKNCQQLLESVGIKHIYYTNGDRIDEV